MNGAKTVGDLMKKSTDELKAVYLQLADARGLSLMDYMPTCDGKFLPLDPGKALKDGAAHDIKILMGTTADEWRCFLLAAENLFELLRADPQKNSPILSRYNARLPQEVYQKWLDGRHDSDDTYGDFATQLDWRVGQELATEYQSAFDDTYYYLFSEWSPIENLRSCHAVDLPFTFNVGDHIVPNPNPKFAKVIQSSWTAFATTGTIPTTKQFRTGKNIPPATVKPWS